MHRRCIAANCMRGQKDQNHTNTRARTHTLYDIQEFIVSNGAPEMLQAANTIFEMSRIRDVIIPQNYGTDL